MKIVRQRKPQMKMEMSPLIDCIFQLLIFFMLSSTFLTPSIPLSLPTAAAGGPPQSQQVIITLDAEGKVFLNNGIQMEKNFLRYIMLMIHIMVYVNGGIRMAIKNLQLIL